MKIHIEPGDVFTVKTTGILGGGVDLFQKLNSSDGEGGYRHGGILLNDRGDTFEALLRIGKNNISKRVGLPVLIARPVGTDINNLPIILAKKLSVLDAVIKYYEGSIYPFWRLPLHIIPPLARQISYKGKFVVCSELVAAFEYQIGARHSQFTGTTPDQLSDEWHRWKNFNIIFEGILKQEYIT